MFKVVAKSKKKITLKYYREISPWEGRSFDQFFSEFDGKYEEIDILLHCYGGNVIEGNLIYNILTHAESKVNVDVMGIAASMGTIFLITGQHRRMVENGFLMFHRVQGGIRGTAADMENGAKLMKDMEANFIKKLAVITGMTEDEVKKKWFEDGADHWINAKEAKELGLIHEIIEPAVKNLKDLNNETAAKLGAQALFGKYAAVLTKEEPQEPILNKNTDMKKEELIARYKLTGVTAESSDTAIMEAIDTQMKNEKDKADKAQNELNAIKDTEITEAVEAAAKDGRITAVEGKTIDEQKATFVKIGKSAGIEALKAALGAAKPHKTIVSQLPSGGGSSTGTVNDANRDSWDWDKWQKEDSNGLEALVKTDKEAFDALYNAKYKKN